jgi:hypothetical protein
MTWKDIGSVIGKAAPVIGGLLGGPVGTAAGKLVANVLGCEESPEAVQAELAKNPEAFVKLKTAEIKHKGKLAELALEEKRLLVNAGIEHRKIDTADIQDARERDEKIRASGSSNMRANLMIIGDVAGLLCCLAAMVYVSITALTGEGSAAMGVMNGPLGYLAGQFGSGLQSAHQFEFGSSRGSKDKDLMLTPQKGS